MRPNVHYTDDTVTLWHGDCIDTLKELPDNSIDSIVTDPPYGLSAATPQQIADTMVAWATGDRTYMPPTKGFMGASWDAFVPPPALWDEALRVLKPGGHLLAFAGSRTQDLMGLSIRLAGFEIRDSVAWINGAGFPKSLDVSRAIDKAAGAEREVIGQRDSFTGNNKDANTFMASPRLMDVTAPATDEAKKWSGWGTALKPAHEPVVVARKPLEGTVAANVQRYGTGALNIDATRIGARWPANVALDETTAPLLDQQSGTLTSGKISPNHRRSTAGGNGRTLGKMEGVLGESYADSGGASRFFKVAEPDVPFLYAAKAPKRERPVVDGVAHNTVKPLSIMRWLVKLVTPPGGVVLEPFAGSGTTVEACLLEGFNCIAVEREAEYLPLIMSRIDRQAGTLPHAA